MKIFLIIMLLLGVGFVGVRSSFKEASARQFNAAFFLSFAVVLGVGALTHGGAIFIAVAFASTLLCQGNRVDVGCRYVGMVVLIPNVLFPITAGGVYVIEFNVAEALATGALVASLLRSAGDSPSRFSVEDCFILVLVLILGVAQTRVGSFTAHSRAFLDALFSIGLPYVVLQRSIRNRADLKAVIEMVSGLALMLALVAIYETAKRWEIFDIIWANQSNDVVSSLFWNMRAGFLRAPATFKESTSFSVFEMVGVFATVAARRSFRNDSAWLGALGFTIFGLLTAQSRGATIALLLGLVVIMLARRRFGSTLAMIALSGALVGAVLIGAHSNQRLAEFVGAGQGFRGEADYRQALLRRGMQEGMKHWAVGSDELQVRASLADIMTSQGIIDFVNSYLYFFLISGVVGLVPLLVSLAFSFKKSFARTSSEAGDRGFQAAQTFIYGALPGVLVALFFTSFFERNPIWLLLGLAANRVLHFAPPGQRVPRRAAFPMAAEAPAMVVKMPAGSGIQQPIGPVSA